MPTYEYRCPQGHDFEKFFSRISEAASVLPCPDCGQEAERRISGGAGLLFKGSGFYLTDYGRNAHRAAPSDGGKTGSGSESAGSKAESGGAKDKASGGAGSSAPAGGSSSGGSSSGGSGSGSSGSSGGSGGSGGSRGGEK